MFAFPLATSLYTSSDLWLNFLCFQFADFSRFCTRVQQRRKLITWRTSHKKFRLFSILHSSEFCFVIFKTEVTSFRWLLQSLQNLNGVPTSSPHDANFDELLLWERARLRPIRLRPLCLFEHGPFHLGQFDLGQRGPFIRLRPKKKLIEICSTWAKIFPPPQPSHLPWWANTVHGRVGSGRVGPPKVGAPKGGAPKFRVFCPSPATIFFLSYLSWGSFRGFFWCLKQVTSHIVGVIALCARKRTHWLTKPVNSFTFQPDVLDMCCVLSMTKNIFHCAPRCWTLFNKAHHDASWSSS